MDIPVWKAGLAGLTFFALSTTANALDLSGQWTGEGNTVSGDCPTFDILVSIQDQKLTGRVFQGDNDFSVSGHVSDDGQLSGEVKYYLVAIAEITGDLTSGRGIGTWQTFKGPSCAGKFEVKQLPDGVEPQIARRPIRAEPEFVVSD